MENLTLSFSAALIMGLAFGAGPCNITCLPYLGPVFLGRENNKLKTSWKTIVPFSLGRLSGYTLLGTIAGSFGMVATSWIENGIAGRILGVATILAGILLLKGNLFKQRKCAVKSSRQSLTAVPVTFTAQKKEKKTSRTGPYLSLSLFMMGTGMALNPCLPLITILTVAAAMATPEAGARLGIAFGIGAVIIPTFFFGLVVAYFSQQIKENMRQWQRSLEQISAYMLIFLGTITTLGWIQPS
jgi:cytochrome c biogenesis protein CcdA